jgi:uncharacterized protein involved in exopolysaccharide biosynthesis
MSVPVEPRYPISPLRIATILLEGRRRLLWWTVVGAAGAAILSSAKSPRFEAYASFMPQNNDPMRSGLSTLAGQLGVSVSSGGVALSPAFYARLIESPNLLKNIARDTIGVAEMGGKRVALTELLGVSGDSRGDREERATSALSSMIRTTVTTATGVVETSVSTKWASVSLAIERALVDQINLFNTESRQGQAAAERKFIESRMRDAGAALRDAEDHLETFLKTNRQFETSAQLAFQRDRLQRDLILRQQVFTELVKSYEEVRIREVRDTPIITMIELPTVRRFAQPRWRTIYTLVGAILGACAAVIFTLVTESLRTRSASKDPEVIAFLGTLSDMLHREKNPS